MACRLGQLRPTNTALILARERREGKRGASWVPRGGEGRQGRDVGAHGEEVQGV